MDKLAGAKEPKRPERTQAQPAEVAVGGSTKKTLKTLPLTKTVLAVAVIGASFYAGFGYGKDQQASTTLNPSTSGSQSQSQNQNSMSNGFSGGNGFGGYGRFGGSSISTSTVTAISSSSITTKDSSGNAQTYAITSGTLITDSGSQVSTSDIQTGDSVIVIPERDDTSTARRIIVNPDFGQSQSGTQSQPVTVDPSQTELN